MIRIVDYGVLLLVLGFMCCSPFTPAIGDVELIHSEYTLFQVEEWTEHSETYIRTFGEIQVSGTVRNTGQGEAHRVQLTIHLYVDADCRQLIYEGQSPICERIEAGASYRFTLKHHYEFTRQGGSKGVKVSVSND